MPKVSVVIPVYNAEIYLRECLDSVVDQTLQDIEIICVDDGSTDSSPKILDEYAAADDRVKVIHKANGGYGQAMNVGMAAAAGEYIGIVESDDLVLSDMLEVLYSKAAAYQLDVVKSDYFHYWGGYDHIERKHGATAASCYDKVLDGKQSLMCRSYASSNWSGIYRRGFLNTNNIVHNETPGASYQDTGFSLQVMAMAKRIMWIDEAFYMYRQDNPGSSVKDKRKMLAVLTEYERLSDILLDRQLVEEWRLCNVYRIDGHRFTFTRIDDSLKKEYAHVICEDHQKIKDHIAWEAVPSSKWLFDWLQKIIGDFDGVYEEFTGRVRPAVELLHGAEHIILYGTGERGKRVAIKLLEMGLHHKILFAAETAPTEGKKLFCFDVKDAREILQYKDSALVLVAAGKENGEQIKRQLERMGIANYMGTDYVHLWR